MGNTVSINMAMHAMGYGASPDNKATLVRYIKEAQCLDLLPEDYNPFIGDRVRVKAEEVKVLKKAIRVDTPAAFTAGISDEQKAKLAAAFPS